jgi:hypothetical protein
VGGSSGGAVSTSLYKTSLCQNFSLSGTCNYGGACMFAHSAHELRASPRLAEGVESTAEEDENRRKRRAIEAKEATAVRKSEQKKCAYCKRFSCIC